MNDATKAVFLSYAREDADAARRIAEALRSQGIEVWFDQSELRGGDAWDQDISGHIRDCALFLPVISAATQARREGYFRREWKLAVERTHDMADGTHFLLPVVIDDTKERDALVPKSFLQVQWTRLSSGEVPPAFCERVRKLLSGGVGARAASPAQSNEAPHSPAGGPPALPGKAGRRWLAPIIAGTVAVAAIGIWALLPKTAPAILNPEPRTQNPEPKTARDLASAKSIAVLPFANMSDEKDASAFFADGMHEDILTNLALIRELRVVSRTSVEQYRGTKKTIRQIGGELGAAYILEGSVRRAGNQVRVTGQLINARTDEHMWAKSFDRELKDIFAIQAALAQEIAAALQTAISPGEKKLLERRPTENLAAYDLYLKARELSRAFGGTMTAERQITLLQAAVDLDSKFGAAWAHLCFSHGWLYYFDHDHTPARVAKARAAMEAAIRVAPDSPEAMRAIGDFSYYGLRDFAGAAAQYLKIDRLQPNSPNARTLLGAVYGRLGRWPERIAEGRRAAELDPGDLLTASTLTRALTDLRRYDEALVAGRRVVNMAPDNLQARWEVSRIFFRGSGSTRETNEMIARFTAAQANSPVGIPLRRSWALQTGNLDAYLALNGQASEPASASDEVLGPTGARAERNREVATVMALKAKGESTTAAEVALRVSETARRSELENQPENALWRSEVSAMQAVLGDKDAALRNARKAVELCPESVDAVLGPIYGANLAFVHAWTGDKERAIAEYARLLRKPSQLNVHEMKHHPAYLPLRDDPRFEALLNDPKNNAPLF